MDEEVLVFTSMTEAVREVSTAIRDSTSVNVHLGLYSGVMGSKGTLSDTAKIATLGHLVDNKA